jgi:hypothetical protein
VIKSGVREHGRKKREEKLSAGGQLGEASGVVNLRNGLRSLLSSVMRQGDFRLWGRFLCVGLRHSSPLKRHYFSCSSPG